MQEVVCDCSGKPIKENSRPCRCECPAMIRLLRTQDNGWYITEHRANHNHSLTPKCGEKVNWPSHKHFDSKGLFSVKSAYKTHVQMLKREAGGQVGQSSETNDQSSAMFTSLWKLKCPPKVHHFLWRLAHNSHPMYMNIERRGVELDTRCAVCGKYFEDWGHLYFKCKWVKQHWRALLMDDIRTQLAQLTSRKEVIQAILQLPEKKKL